MFKQIKADDVVTCVVGERYIRLPVTGLTPFAIVCGDLIFDSDSGSCVNKESPFHLGECFLLEP